MTVTETTETANETANETATVISMSERAARALLAGPRDETRTLLAGILIGPSPWGPTAMVTDARAAVAVPVSVEEGLLREPRALYGSGPALADAVRHLPRGRDVRFAIEDDMRRWRTAGDAGETGECERQWSAVCDAMFGPPASIDATTESLRALDADLGLAAPARRMRRDAQTLRDGGVPYVGCQLPGAFADDEPLVIVTGGRAVILGRAVAVPATVAGEGEQGAFADGRPWAAFRVDVLAPVVRAARTFDGRTADARWSLVITGSLRPARLTLTTGAGTLHACIMPCGTGPRSASVSILARGETGPTRRPHLHTSGTPSATRRPISTTP